MQVLLTCAYGFLFYYIIRRSKFFLVSGFKPWVPGVIFLLKCMSGILLGLLYTYYYTNHQDADSFKFFTDSRYIYESLFTKPYDFIRMFTGINENAPELRGYYLKTDSWLNTNPIFNDNKTIIRMNVLFRFFSLGYYYVHVIFINFISFAGLFFLYKSFLMYVREKEKEMFLLTFLLPSVMFWGSGLLKDGILLGGFGLFIYAFTLIINKSFSLKRLLALFTGLAILFMTKVYVIAIIAPGIAAWWLTRKSSGRKIAITFVTFYVIYLTAAFNLYRVSPDYNLAAELFYKQKNFIEIAEKHSASQIPFPRIECSGTSVLLNSPWAFSNTMFRPFISDAHGKPMIMLSALENLFILFLILLFLISADFRKKKLNGYIIFNLIFIILLYILIGLSSPVLGAIVRYKIVSLPSLMFILIYYYNPKKLKDNLALFVRSNKRRLA